MNGTSGLPLPPFQWCKKWRVFAPSRLHHCFRGRGLIVPFYSVQDCNLGRNRWNIWTTPPPLHLRCKNGAFLLLPAFIIGRTSTNKIIESIVRERSAVCQPMKTLSIIIIITPNEFEIAALFWPTVHINSLRKQRFSIRRNLKTPALGFGVNGGILKTKLFEND